MWPDVQGIVRAGKFLFGGGPPSLGDTSDASIGTSFSSTSSRKRKGLPLDIAVERKRSKYEIILAEQYYTSVDQVEGQPRNSDAVYDQAHFHTYEIKAKIDKQRLEEQEQRADELFNPYILSSFVETLELNNSSACFSCSSSCCFSIFSLILYVWKCA